MPYQIKPPMDYHIVSPNIVLGYKYLKHGGWTLFGYYCPHCSLRRLNADLLDDHAKTCRETTKQLKQREDCYRWFKGKYKDYAKAI